MLSSVKSRQAHVIATTYQFVDIARVSRLDRGRPAEYGERRWRTRPASQEEAAMVRISVLYATSEGKKFDHDYYVNRHMKLVRERLGSFGLVRTEVDKGVAGGAPGAPAPFVAVGHVYFNSLDGFQKGMGQHGKEIMGDVPNYTNIQPQIQISEIIG
jgi:uncharacterized protein (TIGR02118 family)